MITKTCTKCNTEYSKPFKNHFSPDNRKSGRLQAQCKKCRATTSRVYYSSESGYDAHLKRTYGLSIEDYNRLFAEQNGCCLICGKHQSNLKYKLAVDHDHKTGEVRGLLCKRCNAGLGNFKDSEDMLQKAIMYLGACR